MTTSCRVHANVVLCTCDLSGTVNLSRKLFSLFGLWGFFALVCFSLLMFTFFFFACVYACCDVGFALELSFSVCERVSASFSVDVESRAYTWIAEATQMCVCVCV